MEQIPRWDLSQDCWILEAPSNRNHPRGRLIHQRQRDDHASATRWVNLTSRVDSIAIIGASNVDRISLPIYPMTPFRDPDTPSSCGAGFLALTSQNAVTTNKVIQG